MVYVERQQQLPQYIDTDEVEDVPLPEELVTDILGDIEECADFAAGVLDSADEFEEIREELDGKINIANPSGLTYDSVGGVDGSYTAIEGAGMSIGLCSAVCAGKHFTYTKEVFPSPDSQDLGVACQGIGTMLEMKIAAESSEDLIIYDGSFVSALVNLNQLLGRINETRQTLWSVIDPIMERLYQDDNYPLRALRDTTIVGSPKQSSSTYFLDRHYPEYVNQFSDRAFFSLVLEPNEYITIDRKESGTNYGRGSDYVNEYDAKLVESFYDTTGFKVCFYKPEPWSRAYRLEIPRTHSETEYEKIIRSFGQEIVDPAMLEPYPQWLADTLCKKIVEMTDVMKEGIQNRLSDEGYDSEDVNALLRGYRTEIS